MKHILHRINGYMLFFVLLTIVLYYGRAILVPIVFAALLAMLMAPLCRWLDQRRWPRAAACFACIFILFIVLAGMLAIVAAQINTFIQDVSLIREKGEDLLSNVQSYIEHTFNIPPDRQLSMAKKQLESNGSAGGMIGAVIGSLTNTIAGLLLTLVYTFLFLYNKEQYEIFFLKLYRERDPEEVREVVHQISLVSQRYLTGRAFSILILTVLYAIGLLIVGIKHAILLAGIAALLTIVPYVGSTLGGMFPFMMALATETSYEPALWTAFVIIFIQAMDNYFIEPRVVGGEVNLSAISSILIIIIGGILWGVAGMILFIPLLGIIKIVCDHVESLQPFGYLVGDPDGDKPSFIKQWIQRLRRRKANP